MGGFGSARGPDAIREMLERYLGPTTHHPPSGAHHLITNLVIDVDGDSAAAWSRWTFVAPDADGSPTVLLCGHHDDILVRERGTWRFARRVAVTDLPRQPG